MGDKGDVDMDRGEESEQSEGDDFGMEMPMGQMLMGQ